MIITTVMWLIENVRFVEGTADGKRNRNVYSDSIYCV